MSEIINWVLNAKVKDIPEGFCVLLKNYRNYKIHVEYDDKLSEIEVEECDDWSNVRITNLDPEAKILDVVEDAIKLIEKYKSKTKKKESKKTCAV